MGEHFEGDIHYSMPIFCKAIYRGAKRKDRNWIECGTNRNVVPKSAIAADKNIGILLKLMVNLL